MADEGWKIAISGLSEVADYYLKSKALDMTEGQLALQQANRIAEQEIKERERRHDKEWQYQMFEYQNQAQKDAVLAAQAFQRKEKELDRDARASSQNLQVLLSELSTHKADRKRTEALIYKDFDRLSIEYKTGEFDKVTEQMKIGKDDFEARQQRNIDKEIHLKSQLDTALKNLSEQRTQFETMLGDPKWAGLDQIVSDKELERMISTTLTNMGEADQDAWYTRDGTDLPGFRSAWKEGGNRIQRNRAINLAHSSENKKIDLNAARLFEQLRLGLRGDKAFVKGGKVEGLGKFPANWKKAFPKSYEKAMGAFGLPNWEDFMATVKTDPVFEKELKGQKNIILDLQHLEYYHTKKMNLLREKEGLEPVGGVNGVPTDLDSVMLKLQAIGKDATKEDYWKFMKNNVPAGTDPGVTNIVFTEIEDILKAGGDTGDHGTDYFNWYQAEVGNTPPPTTAAKEIIHERKQEDRWGKVIYGGHGKLGSDEMYDPVNKLVYVNSKDWSGNDQKIYFIKKPGKNSRTWVTEQELVNIYPDEDWVGMKRPHIDLEKGVSLLYDSDAIGASLLNLRKKQPGKKPLEAGPISGSLMNLMLGRNLMSGRSPLFVGKDRAPDTSQDAVTTPSRGLSRDLPEQTSESWQARLDLYGSADSTYKSHIDSSYKAIEDSLLKIDEDKRMEARQIGNYWGITDADDFFNLLGTDKQWQYDMALDAFPEFKALYENYDAQGNLR